MAAKPTYHELKQRLQVLEKELVLLKSLHGTDTSKLHHLEDILNNTNAAVFLKRVDFSYLFINKQFELLGQIEAAQVAGKDDFMLFPVSVAELFRSQDEEVVRRGKAIEFEETIALPGGVRTFITAKFPLFGKDGNVAAVGGVCTDITARKEAESKLKEAEEKYRSIVQHSPLGIIQIDREGVITTCNEKLAEILKSEVHNIVGLNLMHSIDDPRVQAATSSALAGKMVEYQGWYRSFLSGHRAYLRGVFSPIYSCDGEVVSAIGIIEDSTARKRAEDSMREVHEELERRVVERTEELDQKNRRLQKANAALEILLEKRETDRRLVEERVMEKIDKLINPYLEKLLLSENVSTKKALINMIRTNIEEVTSSFVVNNQNILAVLTPAQMQIADMIRNGHTTKEIARLLNLSPSTIACHRQEIRKRLALTNKKANLQSVLAATL